MNGLSGFLEGLVVSLREGIEVALVIGVLFAYLTRTGRGAYLRFVMLGLASALLASLAAAILLRRYGLDPDSPALEGSLMVVAAGLVASLLAWMWKMGRTVRSRMERRLQALVSGPEPSTPAPRAALGVFAFTFFMVLREGVETALFLVVLTGTAGIRPLPTALGASLGLGLAALFGMLLVKGSVRANLSRFFAVTGLVLSLLVVKLVAGGMHEFFEAGLLPNSPLCEQAVELLTSATGSSIILALLVAAPLACLAWDWWRGGLPRGAERPNGARP